MLSNLQTKTPALSSSELEIKKDYNDGALYFLKKYSDFFPFLSDYATNDFPDFRIQKKIAKEITIFINHPRLRIKELRYFLELLVFKKMDINILKDMHLEGLILKHVKNMLDAEEPRNQDFNAHQVEIFWSLQKLKFTHNNLRILNPGIIESFITFLKKNPPLSYLHLSAKLNITAYTLQDTSFNPFPALLEEIKKSDKYVEARKLLRSISLLRYSKNNMTFTQRNILLDAIPPLLMSIENQVEAPRKIGYFVSLFWVLARLDFDYNDLTIRKWNNKSIINHVLNFYQRSKNELVGIKNISTFLWSMAVMNVPREHSLYKEFMEKSLCIINDCPSKNNITASTASKILLSYIAYAFNLEPIEYLKIKINTIKSQKSSLFHLNMERVVIALLDQEREKDSSIPYPPRNMTEFKIPGSHGAIVSDTALYSGIDGHFIVEFDGVLHSDRMSSDKFKNRLFKLLNTSIVRIADSETLRAMGTLELISYLKEKVIEPYLNYHRERISKKTETISPTKDIMSKFNTQKDIKSNNLFTEFVAVVQNVECKESILINSLINTQDTESKENIAFPSLPGSNDLADFLEHDLVSWPQENFTPLSFSKVVQNSEDHYIKQKSQLRLISPKISPQSSLEKQPKEPIVSNLQTQLSLAEQPKKSIASNLQTQLSFAEQPKKSIASNLQPQLSFAEQPKKSITSSLQSQLSSAEQLNKSITPFLLDTTNKLETNFGFVNSPAIVVVKQRFQKNSKISKTSAQTPRQLNKDEKENLLSGKSLTNYINEHVDHFLEGKLVNNVDQVKKELYSIIKNPISEAVLCIALRNNLLINEKTTTYCLFFKRISFELYFCADDFRKDIKSKFTKKIR